MRLSTKLSGIVAVGGVAALGAGLISSGGIGANFIADADATANFSVGSFDCSFANTTGVALSNSAHTAAVSLGKITTSSGQKTVNVTLKNSGDIDLAVNWLAYPDGDASAAGHISPVFQTQNQTITSGNNKTFALGATWTNLDNRDLSKTGEIIYYARCVEPASNDHPNVILFARDGASSNWIGDTVEMNFPKGVAKTAGTYAVLNATLAALPSQSPSYTVSNAVSGTPRFQIQLSDGASIQAIPDPANQKHIGEWTYYPFNGAATAGSWQTMRSLAGTATASTVQLLGDTSSGGGYDSSNNTLNAVTNVVSCLQYNGAYYVGASSNGC